MARTAQITIRIILKDDAPKESLTQDLYHMLDDMVGEHLEGKVEEWWADVDTGDFAERPDFLCRPSNCYYYLDEDRRVREITPLDPRWAELTARDKARDQAREMEKAEHTADTLAGMWVGA